ncbi:hypothetical protein GCM10023178_15230 [Actinomadura luteofluorescens]
MPAKEVRASPVLLTTTTMKTAEMTATANIPGHATLVRVTVTVCGADRVLRCPGELGPGRKPAPGRPLVRGSYEFGMTPPLGGEPV